MERLEGAVAQVEEWLAKSDELTEEKQMYLRALKTFNRIVTQNDLP